MGTQIESSGFYDQLVVNVATDGYYQQAMAERTEPQLPRPLLDWLGRLRLLYGVPFEYLVPNEKLLPKESVRFFYLDRNWTDRLVDGALSVGKTTTRDYAHHHTVNDLVLTELDDQERYVRLDLREELYSWGTMSAIDVTGMLMRSRIVSGWPGLEVRAYSRIGLPLTLLRMDRPAPDLLFCLFRGIPGAVEIEEPREGVQFGVDMPGVSSEVPSGFELKLRHITGDEAGREVEGSDPVPVPVRRANRQVIHVRALAAALGAVIGDDLPTDPGDPLSPAGLAVQMLQFPYCQRFAGADEAPEDVADWWNQQTMYQAATFVTFRDLTEAQQEVLMLDAGGGA